MLRLLFKFFVVVVVLVGGGYAAWKTTRVVPPDQQVRALLRTGDVVRAQVVLRGMIKADPRNSQAHLLLAETQMTTSDWISVEKESKILRALGVDRTLVLPMLVRAYAMQGKWAEILADVPAVAPKPEEQGMNLALRSVAVLGMGDAAQAQALVEAGGRLQPNEFLVHLQRGRLALVRKDAAAAVRSADAALAVRPTSTQALQLKSEALVLGWDTSGAIAAMDQAVALAPQSQDLRLARASLLMSLGMDRPAQGDVNAIFEMTSSNATALFYNAVLMQRAGLLADANVEFDKLGPQLDQFPRAYLSKAQIAVALGNLQSALESLDRLLKLVPGDPEGVRLSAQVEITSGRPARAVQVLVPITGPGTRDALALDLRGRALFMLGRMPEAIDSFRRASSIAPDNKTIEAHLIAAQTRFGVAPVPEEQVAQ